MELKKSVENTDNNSKIAGRKKKQETLINAALIGFMIGIIAYSLMVNSFGFLTLIPLFIAFKLLKDSKKERKSDSPDKLFRK